MELERLLRWMEPSIDLSYPTTPLDESVANEVLPAAGRSEATHRELLAYRNGFFAFEGALHVFGACAFPPNHSLRAWNDPTGWRAAWGRLTEGMTFFAEDAFGEQFAYRDGRVVHFRAVMGGVQPVCATLEEWIEAVFIDPERYLKQRLFRRCSEVHGPLPRGGHFGLQGRATSGETLDPARFQVVPARDNMELRGTASMIVRKSTSALQAIKAPR